MLDANTLGTLGLYGQAFGAIQATIGAYNQASMQKSALDYYAQISSNNAKLADYQGRQAGVIGQTLEQNSELRTAGVYGAQRAGLAANGVDLGEGSANDILTTTKMMGTRDALTIRDNAARQQWGFAVEAQNYTAEAAAEKASAGMISPLRSSLGSAITGATAVAKSYYGFKKYGVLS